MTDANSKTKKVLLLCATSNSVRNFRQPMIKMLKKNGCRVGLCVYDDENKDLIKNLGVDYFLIPC